jgi:serine/threonine protein phosphatase PrpC
MEQQAHLGRATEHINRNILFTCLGSPAKPVYDLSGPVQLVQGDRVLLCSDGLWGTVEDDEIVHELSARPLEQAIPELVETALRRGGARCDNVTVLAMEWETADARFHRRHRGRRFCLHHPVGRARPHHRRPGRRRHRTFDRRDQRGDPAQRRGAQFLSLSFPPEVSP